MSKRAEDPLIPEIRIALMPGRLVRWNEVSGMVSNLDRVQERVEALGNAGGAKRAVQLYEALGDASPYAALCGRLGFSPRDCEHLAKMEITKKQWAKALELAKGKLYVIFLCP